MVSVSFRAVRIFTNQLVLDRGLELYLRTKTSAIILMSTRCISLLLLAAFGLASGAELQTTVNPIRKVDGCFP